MLGSVLTFNGLASEIADRAGYAARRLTSLQRELVLAKALEATQFEALRAAAATAGFPQAAGELIAELQRSLITPERFAGAMSAWAAEDPRRRPYARDVAAIYSAYAAELERLGRVDPELYTWRALDALRAAPGRWGTESLFFYGFDDLHPLERDAIETLARVVGAEVTVSLTYEAGRSALTARAEVVEELRPLADRVQQLPASAEHYEPESRHALHHLERELFEPEPERIDPGKAIQLLEAGGELAEAELAAAEVLSLIRSGVPGDEIAVVYRSPAHAATLVEHVFGSYGIPVATDRRTALDRTPLGHSLLALARGALQDDTRGSRRGPARVPAGSGHGRPRRRRRPTGVGGPPPRTPNRGRGPPAGGLRAPGDRRPARCRGSGGGAARARPAAAGRSAPASSPRARRRRGARRPRGRDAGERAGRARGARGANRRGTS